MPAATALADSLEPHQSVALRGKPSRLPWVIAAALVVGGGVTAAVLIATRKPKAPEGYHPVMPVEGITAGEQFGPRLVETDGTVAPVEIERGYEAALAELRAFKPKGSGLAIPDPLIDEIVVLSRAAFCSPRLYENATRPTDCQAVGGAITLSPTGKRVVAVVSERAKLPASLRDAVKEAVCRFPASDDVDTCTLAEEWVKSRR